MEVDIRKICESRGNGSELVSCARIGGGSERNLSKWPDGYQTSLSSSSLWEDFFKIAKNS